MNGSEIVSVMFSMDPTEPLPAEGTEEILWLRDLNIALLSLIRKAIPKLRTRKEFLRSLVMASCIWGLWFTPPPSFGELKTVQGNRRANLSKVSSRSQPFCQHTQVHYGKVKSSRVWKGVWFPKVGIPLQVSVCSSSVACLPASTKLISCIPPCWLLHSR